MSDTEQDRLRWIKERPQHETFGAEIKAQIERALKPFGLWFEVSARAKEVDSLVKKLLKKQKYSFDSLPDKVGARVVIRYRRDLPTVVAAIKAAFDCDATDDKSKELGTKYIGYQSIHIDRLRFKADTAQADRFPAATFWAELQVRTLGQHLWSEMAHDSIYKNDEMVSVLPDDIQRRINLMAGQIEVADREFDRLNSELATRPTVRLLKILESHYFTLTSRRPDLELTMQVLDILFPLMRVDVRAFERHLDDFLTSKRVVLESVYSQAGDAGLENITAFLFQPEVLLIYDLLISRPDDMRRLWNANYPEPELERIANAFGISFD